MGKQVSRWDRWAYEQVYVWPDGHQTNGDASHPRDPQQVEHRECWTSRLNLFLHVRVEHLQSHGTELSIWLEKLHFYTGGQVTSTVILSIISDFPLIRATRWRLFNASSERWFKTSHRADSEYHLTNQSTERTTWPIGEQRETPDQSLSFF